MTVFLIILLAIAVFWTGLEIVLVERNKNKTEISTMPDFEEGNDGTADYSVEKMVEDDTKTIDDLSKKQYEYSPSPFILKVQSQIKPEVLERECEEPFILSERFRDGEQLNLKTKNVVKKSKKSKKKTKLVSAGDFGTFEVSVSSLKKKNHKKLKV